MSVGCICIITHVAKTVKRNLFWQAVIFCGEIKKCFSVLVASNEPQANKKFFDPTIFQKCLRGVGEQPTFAEQITELHNETKQKSRRKSEESQLPSKSRGCNEIQGFRGNCGSQGKLGMCPSLAEPDSGGFPRSEVSNYEPQATKSFLIQQFFKNAGEVWASSPHLRSK